MRYHASLYCITSAARLAGTAAQVANAAQVRDCELTGREEGEHDLHVAVCCGGGARDCELVGGRAVVSFFAAAG